MVVSEFMEKQWYLSGLLCLKFCSSSCFIIFYYYFYFERAFEM